MPSLQQRVMNVLRRRKRATNEDDAASRNAVAGPRVPDELITSTDNITAPPDAPIHQFTSWPTPSNVTMEQATDQCQGSISVSPLYDQCVNISARDTTAYIDSCVADILVTTSLF